MTATTPNLRRWFTARANGAQAIAGAWSSAPYTFKTLFEMFREHHAWRDKDGPCFTPAKLIGNRRVNTAVERVSMLVFDLDGQQSYDEVKKILEDSGRVCWLYTTFSHNKTMTPLHVDAYQKWATRVGQPVEPTVESVTAYNATIDRAHVVVTEVRTSKDDRLATTLGGAYPVHHKPVEKMRAVFPFAAPFIMLDQSDTTTGQVRAWKARYLGIAKSLNLIVDRACADPARLYYMPSHPKGTDHHRLDFINFRGDMRELMEAVPDEYDTDSAGVFLNWSAYPAVSADDLATDGRPQQNFAPNGNLCIIRPEDNWMGTLHLEHWCRHHGQRVGQDLLDKVLAYPDVDRGPRGSDKAGNHIACPFEEEHSSFGSKGTFFDPGGGENYFKIYCQHHHCVNRRTEEFLAKMGMLGWVTEADLLALGHQSEGKRLNLPMNIFNEVAAFVPNTPDPLNEIDAEAHKHIEPEEREVLEVELKRLTEQWNSGARFIGDEAVKRLQERSTCDSFTMLVEELEAELQAKFSPGQLLILMAQSSMPVFSASTYFKLNYKERRLTLLPAEFRYHFLHIRALINPLAPQLGMLIASGVAGEHLTRTLNVLAELYGMPLAAMNKEYTRASRQTKSPHELTLEERAGVYDDLYCKVMVKETVKLLRVDQLESKGVVDFLTKQGGYDAHSSDVVTTLDADGKPRETRVFKYWFEDSPSVLTYKNVICSPPGCGVLVSPLEKNTWVGFIDYKNTPPPALIDASPITDHIRDNICRGDMAQYHWIMTWFADLVQNPGRKPHTAVIITGGQGTGKSLVFEHGLNKILAPYAITDPTGRSMSSGFNSEMENRLLMVSEEANHGDDRRSASMLKQFISGSTLRFEKKGQEARSSHSFLRFVFLSNLSTPVNLDIDDRRYMVMQTNPARAGDIAYFQPLRDWLDAGGRVHWYHFLKNWRPEDVGLTFNQVASSALVTEAKLANIKSSLTPAQQFWRQWAFHGEPTVASNAMLLVEKMNLPRWGIDDPYVISDKKFTDLAGFRIADDKPSPKLNAVLNELTRLGGVGFPFAKKNVKLGKIFTLGHEFGTRRQLLDGLLRLRIVTQTEYDEIINAEHGIDAVDGGAASNTTEST